jgi:uncharacterized BrkB/YihY/UPF0761 family membrane protein
MAQRSPDAILAMANVFAYSIIYGSLGVGIALLVWMYLLSFIVLVGAEFNAMLFPRMIARAPAAPECTNRQPQRETLSIHARHQTRQ